MRDRTKYPRPSVSGKCLFASWLLVQVPWKTFASGKASLHVSGLTLVLEPLGSANYDDEIERGLRDAIFAKKQVDAFQPSVNISPGE